MLQELQTQELKELLLPIQPTILLCSLCPINQKNQQTFDGWRFLLGEPMVMELIHLEMDWLKIVSSEPKMILLMSMGVGYEE